VNFSDRWRTAVNVQVDKDGEVQVEKNPEVRRRGAGKYRRY
jgi:hypothetical protein